MLFIVGVGIVLIAVGIIPRVWVPGGVNSANLGWMSEQVAFLTVALTAPPTATVVAYAVVIAAIAFLMPRAIARLLPSRSLVRVVPSEYAGWQMPPPPARIAKKAASRP